MPPSPSLSFSSACLAGSAFFVKVTPCLGVLTRQGAGPRQARKPQRPWSLRGPGRPHPVTTGGAAATTMARCPAARALAAYFADASSRVETRFPSLFPNGAIPFSRAQPVPCPSSASEGGSCHSVRHARLCPALLGPLAACSGALFGRKVKMFPRKRRTAGGRTAAHELGVPTLSSPRGPLSFRRRRCCPHRIRHASDKCPTQSGRQ